MAEFTLPLRTQTRFAVRSNINPYPPQSAEPQDQRDSVSRLGTPIFDQVILDPKNTDIQQGRLDPDTNLDAGALVLNECVVTVVQSKQIVKTPISGKSGTVKEYIGLGDYQITIRGFLVGDNPNERPIELIDKLIEFGLVEKQVVVASNVLKDFRVTSMVIDTFSVDQEAGIRNRVPFVLNCSSDEDEEIILSQNANT